MTPLRAAPLGGGIRRLVVPAGWGHGPFWSALEASASSVASSVAEGSTSTCPGGVVAKRRALSGEQPTEAGPIRRLRGVVPYSFSGGRPAWTRARARGTFVRHGLAGEEEKRGRIAK